MKIDAEDLIKIIKESNSKSAVLKKLGLRPFGGNFKTLNNFIIKNNVDISHFGNTTNKISDDILEKIVLESTSLSQVIQKANLTPSGAVYSGLYKRIKKLNLSIKHFLGQGQKGIKKEGNYKSRSLKEIMVKDSHYPSYKLKKRLIKNNLLKNECYICSLKDWLNKKLVLHLDHINGNNRDNRLENLRLLCPNCDSQTDTYCGRNKGKNKKV